MFPKCADSNPIGSIRFAQPLSSLDAQFLALETDRNYGHVGSVAILDPSTAGPDGFSLERIKAVLAEREHMLPPFTRRLAEVPLGLDWPYWVRDEHFDLGYHCRELALPAPGSMEQLREQVARIYSRQLDRSRPLWELYLIHGLEGGRMALMTKIHHAAVDGMSAARSSRWMYDVTPEPRAPSRSRSRPRTARASDRDMLLRTVTALPGAPARIVRRVGRLLPHVDVVPSCSGSPQRDDQPSAFAPAGRRQRDRAAGHPAAQGRVRRQGVAAQDLRPRCRSRCPTSAGEGPLRRKGQRRGGRAGRGGAAR
jgi:WS/DGAT/MGAT family acyltransferase